MHIYRIQLPDEYSLQEKFSIKDRENIGFNEFYHQSENKIKPNIIIDHNFHKNKYGFPLSNNEINNFLIHSNIWNIFLENNNPWCLIIESCIEIKTSFYDIIKDIEEMPDDWDIFFPYDLQDEYQNMQYGISLLNPNPREQADNDPYMFGYKWGNSIYCISRKGAEKLSQISVIKDRLDNEILHMACNEEIEIYFSQVNWFDQTKIIQWDWQDRTELIWNTIISNNQWSNQSRTKMQELLKKISIASMNLNINLILCYGSLLAYIRHGEVMPWDDDIDIGIDEKDLDSFFNKLDSVNNISYGEFIDPESNRPYYKIWEIDGEPINNYKYTFPFIDLWTFNKKGNDFIFKVGSIYQNSALNEPLKIYFEGSEFKIPYNSMEVLDSMFIDWKTKIRIYPWCHRLEMPAFYPLTTNIQIAEDGRMIYPDSLLFS